MSANDERRSIGGEIRRVQDDIRRGAREIEERARQMQQEVTERAEEEYQRSKRFLSQTVKNKISVVAKDTMGADIDVDEFVGDIQERAQLEEIANSEAVPMDFPRTIFSIAVVVDILDIFVVEIPFLMSVVNICFSIFLYFWFMGKISTSFKTGSSLLFKGNKLSKKAAARAGRRYGKSFAQKTFQKFARKYFLKHVTKRWWLYMMGSLVWIIQILVLQSFFVLLVWKQQNKMVRIYMATVEKLGEILARVQESEERAEENEGGEFA